jgi:NAD(P)-dependent dehydrogenase (short-subunit alcohol dehydrogenase family)
MACALAVQGYDLVITYRTNSAAAKETLAAVEALGRKAIALPLDCAEAEQFPAFATRLAQALQATWGRTDFDVLINNAGHGVNAPFAQTTPEMLDGLFRTHLQGPFFLTQTLLGLLRDGGQIVNISSGLARFYQPGFAAYGAIKAAVESLSRALAVELGPRGIRVNVIAPGPIETDFGGGVVRDNAAVNAQLAKATALGRVGLPDDIGHAVAGLVAASGGWISGQRIEVSGGLLL